MRFLLHSILLSAAVLPLCAQDSDWDFREIQRNTGLPIESYDYLAAAPPEDAWQAYQALRIGDYNSSKAWKLKQAALLLARNRGMGKYIDELTGGIPHEALKDSDRAEFLRLLGTVPAEWAIRILGKYLFDERPTFAENVSSSTASAALAAAALAGMDLPGAPPVRRDSQGEVIGQDLPAWKKWWYTSESHLDDIVREINPDSSPESSVADSPKISLRHRDQQGSLLESVIIEVRIYDPRIDFGAVRLNAKAQEAWVPPSGGSNAQNITISVEREEKRGRQRHSYILDSQTVATGKSQADVRLGVHVPFPAAVRGRRMQEAALPASKDAYLTDPKTRLEELEAAEVIENEPGNYQVIVTFDSPAGELRSEPCKFTVRDTGNGYLQYLDEIRPID